MEENIQTLLICISLILSLFSFIMIWYLIIKCDIKLKEVK